MQIVEWAKLHPLPATGAVLAAVILFLYLRGGSSSGDNGASAAAQAYYAAESAQAQMGDAVQIAQIQAQAGTAQTQIAADTSVKNNTTWATTDLATTQSNNQTAENLAPYQAEASLVGALAGVASMPGTTTTTSSKSNGFLGIGGGNKTVSTYVPNPSAVSASNLLDDLFSNGFYAGH